MKTLIFKLAFVLTVTQCLLAQNSVAAATKDTTLNLQNYIFGEILGSTLGLSVNYERSLSKKPGGFSLRAGIGFGVVPGLFGESTEFFASVPLGISYNFPISKNQHNFFELGGTYTWINGSDNRSTLYPSFLGTLSYDTGDDLRNISIVGVITGWRHISASGKTQIRLYFMPVLFNLARPANYAIIGFSIGRRF